MIFRVAIVLWAPVALSSTAAQSVPEGIVGQWTSETYVSGATGLVTLEFFPNGTYSRKSVTVTEFGWTMFGTTMLLAPVLDKTVTSVTYGKATEIQVQFLGDSLIASAGEKKMTLKRVTGPVEEGPLLGRWEGLTDMNETTLQDFRADGRLIVSVTQSREGGRYDLDDQVINFQEQIPLPGRKRSKFKIAGKKLLLYISDKLPPLELTRAEEKVAAQQK